MTVTIKDIAEKAEVSVSTVSKALNDNKRLKESTRNRIKKIAQKLNYTPSGPAQALKKGKTNMIAVIVPRINSIYYSALTQAIKDQIKKAGYNLMLGSTNCDFEEEKKYVSLINSGQVDGAIFVTNFKEKLNNKLYENKIPVVNIGKVNSLNPQIPCVKSDLENIAYKLTNNLIENGLKEIAYVGKGGVKRKGFKKAMADNSISMMDSFNFKCEESFVRGKQIGEKLLNVNNLPKALMCSNDELAIGIIQYLQNHGVDVSRKIAITGFDNINMSQVCTPALTTVDIPKRNLGQKAAELLLDLIKGRAIPDYERIITYPAEIIKRESTSF